MKLTRKYTILGTEILLPKKDFTQLIASFSEMKNWTASKSMDYIYGPVENISIDDEAIIKTWLKSYQSGAFIKGKPNFSAKKATLEALQSSSLAGIEDE